VLTGKLALVDKGRYFRVLVKETQMALLALTAYFICFLWFKFW
jgi:hypothetical protein